MKATILRRALLVGALVLAGTAAAGNATDQFQRCGDSAGVTVCVALPSATVSGDVPVTASVDGKVPYDLVFTWRGEDLLTDFKPPWQFTWPTGRYPNGGGTMSVAVKPKGADVGAPVEFRLTLDNPVHKEASPADWASIFHPRSFPGDPLIAAVGDGGDGTPRSDAVAQSILDSQAGLLLFLGDIYDTGSHAEWDYNFGRASYDDPAGGRGWGRLAGFAKPTLGNHEAHHLDAWGDYWHQRPYWETFAWGGVRVLVLDSECQLHSCSASGEQYAWARQVLKDNTYPCVVATWHRPLLGPVPAPELGALWDLVARHGGDLVLNGHQHDMESYAPLGADQAPGGHLVELIAGSGGHIPHHDVATDPRADWQALGTSGALYVSAVGGAGGTASALRWAYKDTSGAVVPGGTGSVTC